MQQVVNQAFNLAGQILAFLWNLVRLGYNWSFGYVERMWQVSFANLPLWKQVLFVAVIVAFVYLLYMIAIDVLEFIQKIVNAVVGLIVAIANQIVPVVVTGGLMVFGAWIVLNATNKLPIPWMN